jgi:serine/threonine-protein kinase
MTGFAPAALSAALADRYRIERELGAGGMATVYLAHDLRHARNVALKVLRPELAAVIGGERFLAEIKTTANLQHPHILALFDSGSVDGTVFYAMPFVEGESLRDRLEREKQLPIDDALRIAVEVADALQYAHERGVIHRDIKPENILLQGGHALVADFGIALAASSVGGQRMTETGMSLGTPKYMSPEQAMGERTLDARTDVYALGCVLYEMLVGDPPYTGSTAQAIVAKVLTEKPAPIIARRDRVPPHVEDAVLTALSKLPADRFASAARFAQAIQHGGAITAPQRVPAKAPTATWRRVALPALLLAALAGVGGWLLGERTGRVPDAVNRFTLSLGVGQGLSPRGGSRVAWSPDGRAFVYVGATAGEERLWLRSLDALGPTVIEGTDGPSSPFFSPDGQQIAFIRTTPFSLNIVPRAGGKVSQIVAGNAISGGGGDWSSDGYIYFDGASSLSRVRPDGTGREDLFALDSAQGEVGLAWPQALPGGRGAIARVRRASDDVAGYTIVAFDNATRKRTNVVTATFARYVPPGYLLYVTADGTLMAAHFDLKRLQVTGTPATIARGLSIAAFGAADVAVSSSGMLLYSAGRGVTSTEPTWIGRDGTTTLVDPEWRSIYANNLSISPDGSRLAVHVSAPGNAAGARSEDVWVKQLPTGPISRLTFDGEQNRRPRWSHDARDVFFISSRSGLGSLYRQRADGSSPATRVASLPNGIGLGLGVGLGFDSPDGRWLILQGEEGGGIAGIFAMQVGVDSVPRPIIADNFRETRPALSPDGRWIAYQSGETGRDEVYVRPFPDVRGGKTQVSTAGGSSPMWSHKGDELFFETPEQHMMAAQVRVAPSFGVVSLKRLFSWAGYFWPYDVSRDDTRFLMLHVGPSGDASGDGTQLILVQNLTAELTRLLP